MYKDPMGIERHLNKLLWPAVIAVIVGVSTPLILSWLQDRSAEVVVRQFYNTVEPKKSVPTQVGGLTLAYQPVTQTPHSVYLVEVANVGKRAEEDVRLQVRFPDAMTVAYDEAPDFKIYRAEEVTLDAGTFFMSLKQFPAGASAPVVFTFGSNLHDVCDVKIKVAGKEHEGKVEPIRGIPCAL